VLRSGQALGPFLLGLVYGVVGLSGTFWASAMAAICFIGVSTLMIKD
jgi:hypothetical protein